MTDREAFKLIGQRAQELAQTPAVKERCQQMYAEGQTQEDIKRFVYRLAIGSLAGIQPLKS